jgi:hypothetical protein
MIIINSCRSDNDKYSDYDAIALPTDFAIGEFSLSEIFDDLIIVPLDSEIPLPLISQIQCFDSTLYLLDQNASMIYRFTLDGKYIDVLENQGRGPEEYLSIQEFHVTNTGQIYINSVGNKKVLIYSNDFNFLRAIPYPEGIQFPVVHWLENAMIFLPKGFAEQASYDWITTTLEGKIIDTKVDINGTRTYLRFGAKDLFTFGDATIIYRYRSSSDTIFGITNKGHFPKYVFTRRFSDGLRMTSTDELFSDSFKLSGPNGIINMTGLRNIYNIYDVGSKLIIAYRGEKSETVLFDGGTYEAKVIVDDNKGLVRIPDDWLNTGQLTIKGKIMLGNDPYVLALIDPIKLKAIISTDDFLKGITSWPLKKSEILDLSYSIDIDDNPLLLLFRCK